MSIRPRKPFRYDHRNRLIKRIYNRKTHRTLEFSTCERKDCKNRIERLCDFIKPGWNGTYCNTGVCQDHTTPVSWGVDHCWKHEDPK